MTFSPLYLASFNEHTALENPSMLLHGLLYCLFVLLIFHCRDVYSLFFCLSSEEYLGCFYFRFYENLCPDFV